MNFRISGTHLDITPALHDYVLAKLDRVMRHFEQVVDVFVILAIDNAREKALRQRAEINVHVKGRDIFVEHAGEDMYAVIDGLMDRLDRQVGRHKEKVQSHHALPAKRMLNVSAA